MPSPLPRRRFLRQLALGVAVAPFVGCASRTNGLEVGVIADPQYADIPDRGTRAYRASVAKLGAAVEHFNARPLDFCVNLGDTIDREWRSYDAILAPLAASRHRWEHVLGNHDFALLDGEKTQVDARLGIAARYRYFDRPGFRFVVLDTGAVSTYASLAGTEARQEAVAELARVKARKLPQAQDWNGAVGPKQLAWFEGVAADAARRGLKKTPLEYIRDNLWVTTSGNWYEPALVCTMMAMGVDKILFAADWPYEANRTATEFLHKVSISDGDRAKIAHANAERLLRL